MTQGKVIVSEDRFLSGRTAMITGGLSGISLETARQMLQRGAQIAMGAPAIDRASTILAELQTLGTVYTSSLDVRDAESVDQFVQNANQQLGPIDILVNTTDLNATHITCGHSEALWQEILNTNLTGPFLTTRACLQQMKIRGWGRIINIGSSAARHAVADRPAFCASKAGLLGFSRAVSLEGAPFGIQCTVVSAMQWDNDILTDYARDAGKSLSTEIACLIEQSAQKHTSRSDDIASAILYLCRDEAATICNDEIEIAASDPYA